MAMDFFIGYSQADKIALLKGISETIMTGQITKVKTSRDEETEFSPNVSNELTYARLCDSIANSPDFDTNDPVQAACAGNARPGVTRMNFGGGYAFATS